MILDSSDEEQGFQLADWRVKPNLSELEKDGKTIQLEPKVMAVLELLASQPGHVFSRQQLETTVWQGTVIGYDALAKAINKLRDALGDDKKQPRYIQTISKKGYRLVANVDKASAADSRADESIRQKSQTKVKKPVTMMRWYITGGIVISLMVVILLLVFRPTSTGKLEPFRLPPTTVQRVKPTIVVLPFRNISSNDKNDYLADGLTSDLTTNLSKQSSLWVTATNAILAYKNTSVSSEEIQRQFKAHYMLRGDVNRVDQSIRINVHLYELENGNILWSERYDRQFTDLFAILDEVTNNILTSLSITLTKEEKRRIANRYTNNMQAYDYFLRGQSQINIRTQDDNTSAREMYQKAVELDPVFARAYAGLAMTYILSHVNEWTSDVENPLQKALEYSKHATDLDKELPESYFVAGFVRGYLGYTEESFKNISQALFLNSNYADAYTMLAWLYVSTNQPELALEQMTKAMHLNPNGGYLYLTQIGKANYLLGNYELALNHYLESQERNPAYIATLYYLAATYVNLERYEEANWMLSEAKLVNPKLDREAWLELVLKNEMKNDEIREKLRNDLLKAESYRPGSD